MVCKRTMCNQWHDQSGPSRLALGMYQEEFVELRRHRVNVAAKLLDVQVR